MPSPSPAQVAAPAVIYFSPVSRDRVEEKPVAGPERDKNPDRPDKEADHRQGPGDRKDGDRNLDGDRGKAGNDDPDDDADDDGDFAPKIPTVRAPYAEEVGPRETGKAQPQSIAPQTGLPLDTSFDAVSWIPNGISPANNGDLNIAPNYPCAGNVMAIAPSPVTPNVLYIGTANGGVWRSNNATSATPHWMPLTDDQMSLSIGGLAMDTSDSSGNTLVAGIGRRSSYSNLGGAQKGVLRTTNGGTTWTLLGATPLAGRSIYNLAARGATMLLAVPRTDNGTAPGLYRTTDTGATFTNMSGATGSGLPAGAVTHLAADPGTLTRFYAHVAGVGVYRSTDSGATWVSVSTGLAIANLGQLALAAGPSGVLYAAELASTSRVFRSTNQGGAWTQMDSVPTNTSSSFNGIVADPSNANLVYLSGLYTRAAFPFSGRIVRGDASLADGSQWVSIASTSGQGTGTAPHTDSHALIFDLNDRLIEGDDGGVYALPVASTGMEGTVSGGNGSAWVSLNGNLQDSEMHTMAYDPVSRIFLGGAQDTGMLEQITPGLPTWFKTSNGDGGDAAVDVLSSPGSSIRYGSSQNFSGFYRNTYNAANVQTASANPPTTLSGSGTAIVRGGATDNMPFVTSVEPNRVAGGRLIIGGNSVTYESTDQGNTVTQIEAAGPNQLARIAYGGVLNGVNNPDVLFYGVGSTIHSRTSAGGAIGSVTFPGGTVQGIALDPANWQRQYILGTTSIYGTGTGLGFSDYTGNLTGVGTFHTIEFMTLPDGNVLMVGADLGAFMMRLSAPGVWTTVGDNLPHAPVFDANFDPAGQVLAVSTLGRGTWLFDCKRTKTPGQYGETFQAFVPGTTALPARVGDLFSSQPGTATGIVDNQVRELQLTAAGNTAVSSAFRLPDLNANRAVGAFSAKWNAMIYGSSDIADGFSLNFGAFGSYTSSNFTNPAISSEDGFGTGLSIGVRTYSGNTPGYYVRVNGTVVPGGFAAKASSAWLNAGQTRHFFEVDWRNDLGLTLRVDGVAIFTNLLTSGYLPAAGDRFVFAARCGGITEDLRLDNIAVFTGGVLAPVTPTAPYYASADDPADGEGAAKAFDGNANTQWLTADYSGSIGATLPSAKTVRLYTFTSPNATRQRDPFLWDFQTSSDGVSWTQHGVQGEQYFVLPAEQRAFVVANPASGTAFRALITANRDDPSTSVAEFQLWEFIPVIERFTVATTAAGGAGSLRQAVTDSAAFDGPPTIAFAPELAGQTITLSGGPIAITNPAGLVIDASSIGVMVISANGSSRIFTIAAGAPTVLRNLLLIAGNTTGNFPDSYGGAIYNQSEIDLYNCTLAGNRASVAGGAIYNQASTVNLFTSTISGNTAQYGGAIQNEGGFITHSSTLANNTATVEGGAISSPNNNTNILLQSTISGNSAPNGGGFKGTNCIVEFSILAGNTATTGPDYSDSINQFGTPNVIGTPPLLAPLDNYGGVTLTMALEPGSPARNAALGSSVTSDQRGFPIIGTPDLGAYEAGTFTNYNAYIWESLPVSATFAQHASTADFDGDGVSNYNEWLALTDPTDSRSFLRINSIVRDGANVDLTFPTVVGRTYYVEYSIDLASWTPLGSLSGTGGLVIQSVGPVTSYGRLFFRVRVGL